MVSDRYIVVKSIYAKNTPNPPKIATFGFCAFSDSTRSTEQYIKSWPLGINGNWSNCDAKEIDLNTEMLFFLIGVQSN